MVTCAAVKTLIFGVWGGTAGTPPRPISRNYLVRGPRGLFLKKERLP
jgi:hypothetical protein